MPLSSTSAAALRHWRLQLVERGFTDVSVLDISAQALVEARRRAGDASPIQWRHEDLSVWRPEREYPTSGTTVPCSTSWSARPTVTTTLETLFAALRPHGSVIIGAFAPDAPDRCSGLPVTRYAGPDLATLLGADFELVATRREEHVRSRGA